MYFINKKLGNNMTLITRDKPFYKTMFIIALPAAFQSLISLAVSMVDNIMVSTLGEVALSAVSVSNQVTALFMALIFGLASGSSALISQYWGKHDMERIKEIFAIVFKICSVVSIVVSTLLFIYPEAALRFVTNQPEVIESAVIYMRIIALSYTLFGISTSFVMMLRFVEIVKITLYISIGSLVANLSLNYILIFGKLGFPAMGVKGAAIATLLTRVLEFIIVYIYTFKVQKKLVLSIKDLFRSSPLMIKDYIKHGIPIALGDSQWALVGVFKAAIIGRLGVAMIAATNVAQTIMQLGMLFTGALAGGACVVVGKTVGQKNYDKTREYSNTIQIMFAVIGIIASAAVFLSRGFAASLYSGLSPDVKELAMQLIAIGAITLIGTTYHASCFIGINRGAGDGRFVFIVDMICGWLIVLPIAYLGAFVFHWPKQYVFLALYIDQCFKWIIAFIRLRGNKWIRNVTRE